MSSTDHTNITNGIKKICDTSLDQNILDPELLRYYFMKSMMFFNRSQRNKNEQN